MVVIYMILTVVYSYTLFKMQKSMEGLLEKNISRERNSVFNQFFFFMISFATRAGFFLILIFVSQASNRFWTKLIVLLLYIPWNVLPVFYILLCHSRTYEQILTAIKMSKVEQSNSTED